MSQTFSAIFAGAAATWRAERDLWIRIAAVFYFLPLLAMGLFVEMPVVEVASPDADPVASAEAGMAAWTALANWGLANSGWLIAQIVFQAWGSATVLVLLFDRDRPTLGQALVTALRWLPVFVGVLLSVTLIVLVGAIPLLVPGLYLYGRTFVAAPTCIAEKRGVIDTIVTGIRHTRRRGWMLLLVGMVLLGLDWFASGFLSTLDQAIRQSAADSLLARAPVAALSAAATAALALIQILVQAAAYRVLAGEPRQGM